MNFIRSTVRLLILGLCSIAPGAMAQTTTTNLTLTTSVSLTAYVQSTNSNGLPSVTVTKLGTKDVLAALATDLGQPTNQLAAAKLLLSFQHVGTTNADLAVVLRTTAGDTTVDTNVLVSLLNNPAVDTARSSKNGTTTATTYSVMNFDLSTTNLTFTTKGHIKLTEGAVILGKNIIDSRKFPWSCTASLTGSGLVGTNSAVFIGTFSASNKKIETTAE